MQKPKKIVKFRVTDYDALNDVKLHIELGRYIEKLDSWNKGDLKNFDQFNKFFGIMLNLKLLAEVLIKRYDITFEGESDLPEQLKNILKNKGIDPSLN